MSVHLFALPEYEPPLRPVPPDPDELDGFAVPAPIPPPPPVPLAEAPMWDERGPVRERLWRLVRLVLEVLDGRRQLDQLREMLNPAVYQSLLTTHRRTGTGWQHRLRTMHTCRPAPDVVEVCATLALVSARTGRGRIVAVAARVVEREGGLVCTALRLLYPSPRSTPDG